MKSITIKKTAFLVSLASLVLALPGCGNNPMEPRIHLNNNFGDTVKHNMAVQIVNPDASAGITTPPSMNGERADRAVTIYQTGGEKEVTAEQTSSQ